MNVCLLNDSFPPVIDGVANVVLNYAKVIHRDYGSVVVAAPRYPGDCDEYPFPVIRYPSIKTPRTAGYRMGIPIPGIVRELKTHQIDIIHCHCPFVSAVISKSLRQSVKAPIVMTYHTKYDIDIANTFDAEILRTTAKKLIVSNIEMCDEVWAVSRGAAENLKSLGFKGDCIVMDNGVDFPRGTAPESLSRLAGDEIGLSGTPTGTPIFLYVGRMMWYKGIRIILDGLLKAKTAGAAFKMVFVGGGENLDEITKLALALGLKDECIFAGPIRDREKLRAIFSRADMFLFPSTFDSAPLAVREAAACGLASVLVHGSAAAEPVTDGRNAVLIDENSDSLAQAVIGLSKNKERMKALGHAAMDELYVSWETAVASAYEQYCRLLKM
ncbi:MAG: glycosyltransferase [Oscillospiraceae bacterium]|jgi:glycosyltransferase involved in cell wall biosynthesis|nr:glycosyltransferase [Oscillospiraceae bacterium]